MSLSPSAQHQQYTHTASNILGSCVLPETNTTTWIYGTVWYGSIDRMVPTYRTYVPGTVPTGCSTYGVQFSSSKNKSHGRTDASRRRSRRVGGRGSRSAKQKVGVVQEILLTCSIHWSILPPGAIPGLFTWLLKLGLRLLRKRTSSYKTTPSRPQSERILWSCSTASTQTMTENLARRKWLILWQACCTKEKKNLARKHVDLPKVWELLWTRTMTKQSTLRSSLMSSLLSPVILEAVQGVIGLLAVWIQWNVCGLISRILTKSSVLRWRGITKNSTTVSIIMAAARQCNTSRTSSLAKQLMGCPERRQSPIRRSR